MSRPAPILIAGGGIGGLAAALALSRKGLASIVLEKRDDAREAGAGIQLGPNAVHALRRVGAADRLAPAAAVPECIHVRDGAAGRTLARLPLGPAMAARHGAPYWTVHRQDLHAALTSEAQSRPDIATANGFEVAAFEETPAGIRVSDATGRSLEGAALIGADGIGSTVRRLAIGGVDLPQSGKTASRTVIAALDARAPLSTTETGVWLTPGAHIVHYPVNGGREIAVVAIIDEGWRAAGWHTPVDRADLFAKLAGFAPDLQRALETVQDWHKWALVNPAPLPTWHRERVALLGDAAHPVLPFLAQGGALAIEDGVVLADTIAANGPDIAAGLRAYVKLRAPRTARVQRASQRNGRIYHLDGAARRTRDLVLAGVPGAVLMRGLDWLYGWKPPGE